MAKIQKRKKGGGFLTAITGCMFAGKSRELIILLDRLRHAGFRFQLFKPANDTRYSSEKVVSHDQRSLEAVAIPIENPARILELLNEQTTVVGIDEAQFFLEGILPVVKELLSRGVDVVVAGLKLDSKNEPFGFMPALVTMADEIVSVSAVCTICGRPATRTQWLGVDKKHKVKGAQVVVGGDNMYAARCPLHHAPK